MNIQPFFDAPLTVQLHAISATEALLLGAWVLLARKKGDRLHKVLGYIWVANMAIAIATSWFIHELQLVGPFSPIHALSALGTVSLVRAVWQARSGDIRGHQSTMRGLYFGGLVAAGVLAFLPGRRLNSALAGGFGEEAVFALVLTIAAIGTFAYTWKASKSRRKRTAALRFGTRPAAFRR